MKVDKEKVKETVLRFADFMEKAGVKLTKGLLIYTVILCILTVNLDRLYIRIKLKSTMNKAFEEVGNIFSGNEKQVKNYKKKKKFFAPKPKEIVVGDLIQTELYEINVRKAGFINKLIPPHIREWSYYSYYEPKDKENTLIDIVFDVKNLDTASVNIDNTIQSPKAIYNSKYEYDGFFAIEEADGSDFDTTRMSVNPLQTRKIHLLIELPKVSKSDNNPVEILFDINNHTYKISLKSTDENVQEPTIIKKEAQEKPIAEQAENDNVKKETPKVQNVKSVPAPKKVNNAKPISQKSKNIPQKDTIKEAKDALFN